MIPRRRLLATTLLAAAAAGIPVRAAAQPGLPVLDGTVPEPLTARGAAGGLEPGFPLGHLAVTWSGAASAGSVRFRTAADWGDWQPVVVGALPPVLAPIVQASLGSMAVGAMLSALGLLGVVCGLALPETRHRSLRGATFRPALAEG